MPKVHARTGFDLDEHQVATPRGDDVYLTSRTTPIAFEDAVTGSLQERHGNVFTAPTESPAGRISTRLTHAEKSVRRLTPAKSESPRMVTN